MLVVDIIPGEEAWSWWKPPVLVLPGDIPNLKQALREGSLWKEHPWATRAYLSAQKITLARGKQVLRFVSHKAVDITQRAPWDYSKAYLKEAFLRTKVPRFTRAQWDRMRRYSYGPQYAMPGTYDAMAYVDIRAAYYTLYTLYWTVDYSPGRWVGRKMYLPVWHKELRENKLARNGVWGIMRSSRLVWMSPDGRVQAVATPHDLSYPQLALIVTDVLHAIASEAVRRWGAVYVMTDGYILPERLARDFIAWLWEMGIEAQIKETGAAKVMGVGSYRIGTRVTRREGSGMHVNNIRHGIAEWLLPIHRKMFQKVNYALGGEFHAYLWPRDLEEDLLDTDEWTFDLTQPVLKWQTVY